MKKYIKPNVRIVANIIYEQSLMAGSITSGLQSDAPEDGGVNTNPTIEVDAKKNSNSSAWDGWTKYTSWDD